MRLFGRQQRASTDAVWNALSGYGSYAGVAADATNSIAQTAAREIAGGLYGSAFAAAQVLPAALDGALDGATLASLARRVICDGEWLAVIEMVNGRISLTEATAWEIRGRGDASTWVYQVSTPAPTDVTTRVLPAAAVVHLRYSWRKQQPWKGVGPFEWAAATAQLVGGADLRMGQELSAETGAIMPVPDLPIGRDKFLESIRKTAGRLVLAPTMALGFGAGRAAAPIGAEYRQERFGGDPPATINALRYDSTVALLNAAGIPAPLGIGTTDGTALRESLARFVLISVPGLAAMLLPELRAKLDAPTLAFDWSALQLPTLERRAKSVQSLTAAGVSLERAAALGGLLTREAD